MLPDEIFLLGILLLEPCILLIYAWKTNKYTDYSLSLLIMYGSAFWEMLNWGAVDRILWMGVLCLVTCAHAPRH
jgi:hypothetical protein